MKLGLLSDIHANVHALEACLEHARNQGVSQYAFLGDLVGYGADPGAVVDRVMTLAEQGAVVLKGNHDELAVRPPRELVTLGDATAGWTHAQLSAAQCDYLDGLPLTRQLEGVLLVHATADDPGAWRYAYDPQTAERSLAAATTQEAVRYVFGGHVHRQMLYYRGADGHLLEFQPGNGVAMPLSRRRHWLATIGSVGQPRDGSPRAMYAVFDTAQSRLTFHRVRYDHHAAADAIRRSGLPEFFADRLELGR